MKRIVTLSLTALLTLCLSVTVFAAPYRNYTVTQSGIYDEPQAYVPDQVIDSGLIGLDQLDGKALSSPQDIVQFDYNGDLLISDSGNNRIVVLKSDLRTVKQIISAWNNAGKEDGFNNNNGMCFYDADKLLYVCDTGNKRIVRFAYDEGNDQYLFDRTFDDPDISKYLSDRNENLTPTPSATPTAQEDVEPTVTPVPAEDEMTEATATPAADTLDEENADDTTTDTSKTSTGSDVTQLSYKPMKIVVDRSMRMFVVSRDCYQGLVELDPDGVFTKFFGATKTRQTLSALLNRLLTAEAKSKRQQNLSTEYSNVTLDPEGFIYGTISQLSLEELRSHFSSSSGVGAALRKLNAAGSDVLQRQGIIPPSGDMGDGAERSTYSYIADVTVSANGLASVLDTQKGRVFTYTSTGELLYVFGALGQRPNISASRKYTDTREEQVGFTKGTSLQPAALELLSDDQTILVLDSAGAQITSFVPTEYGLILREAVNSHEERLYDKAVDAWNKVLGMSSNSAIAYRGVGKVYYMNASEELDSDKQRAMYLDAAEYFKKGYSREEYGKAFYQYRDKVLENVMPVLMTVIIVIALGAILFGWYKRMRRFIKTGGKDE